MFIPLLHYRTEFDIYSTLSPEEFARHLFRSVRDDLDDAFMRRRWEHRCQYQFAGDFFRFIWNGFNMFNGIKQGKIQVSKSLGEIEVKARYEFQEAFWLCAIFSLAPLAFAWGPNEWRIIFLLLIWLVYFVNYAITIFRLNTYFKRKVRETFIDYDRDHNKKLL